jgi:hypothetical protein
LSVKAKTFVLQGLTLVRIWTRHSGNPSACIDLSLPEVISGCSSPPPASGLNSRTYDTFPTFSLEKNFQPPPFEEFLEINFLLYQFYTKKDMVINSLVVYTPACKGNGPEFEPRYGQGVYAYFFVITTH